jgi:protein-tyrosine-phosphatase
MAEAIARREAADVVEPSSAGLFPLGFLPKLTIQTLTKNGCPTDSLSSKAITEDGWNSADLVINLSGTPREEAFEEFEKVEDWDVKDPYGADPLAYQTIFEEIAVRVRQLTERLRKER